MGVYTFGILMQKGGKSVSGRNSLFAQAANFYFHQLGRLFTVRTKRSFTINFFCVSRAGLQLLISDFPFPDARVFACLCVSCLSRAGSRVPILIIY